MSTQETINLVQKKLMLVARSVKMVMVPSMVPYYYMQMQQRIKDENEFDWHIKVRERQGVGEKLTDRENEIDTQLVSSHREKYL